MSVDNKHPDWMDRTGEWALMRHTYRGTQAVKGEGETYLPMPSGFKFQQDNGVAMYRAYQTRAQVPDMLAHTIRGMLGIIHRTEANITMPTAMEPLWERATSDGLTLESFHRKITHEILTTGRFGILVDASSQGSDTPYFAGYSAEAIINWSPERDLFVLDESGWAREGFEWNWRNKWRVLRLEGNGRYTVQKYDQDRAGQGVVTPTRRGGGTLSEIPFVVIGARELDVNPEEPPLIGVARATTAIYRLDADYRHQLFMSGQETLVIINGEAPAAVGAGVVLTLSGDGDLQPDAKYVGPDGVGIEAHRTAIRDERDSAVAAGARMFDAEPQRRESGEARKLRYAAHTATLTSVAMASSAGLEKSLRHAAIIMGLNPEEVVVKPNLRFLNTQMSPTEAKDLVGVWQSRGISYETLYENLQRGEIASEERTFEEELALIDQEWMGEPDEETEVPPTV